MFRPINRATNQETSGAVFGAIFEHCANGLVKSLHAIELRIVSPVRVSVLVVIPPSQCSCPGVSAFKELDQSPISLCYLAVDTVWGRASVL